MKRLMILTAVTVVASAMILASPPASAAPAEHFNWGHQLNATETACPPGNNVLNVMYKIVNSLDSGTGTNDDGAVWWALIDYVLQVQVVETDNNTFCAKVKTQGSFESIGGDGPGCSIAGNCGAPTGRLEAGVVGTFQGGFTQSFTGTFDPGNIRTKGNIGTVDHDCDPTTNVTPCSGAGITRWLSDYFTGVAGFNFDDWWGWVYHAGNNGSWANKIDGNEGNITGN